MNTDTFDIKKITEIFYDTNCPWEFSFITQEFFYGFPILKFNNTNLNDVKYSEGIKNKILIFGSNLLSFDQVLDLCNKNKPTIIIHCSEEWGNKPEFDLLANNCSLYYRQYRHNSYPKNNKVKILPLGYNTEMFSNPWSKTNIKNASERKLDWSFIGNLKTDRREMIFEFSKLKNNFFGNASQIEMKKIYSESKFVPIGRGNITLNCFRIYEALSTGAIPVIVGEDQEIQNTFIDENTSGWLFAKSWEHARIICSDLLLDSKKMCEQQQLALEGWEKRLSDIRNIINDTINSSVAQ